MFPEEKTLPESMRFARKVGFLTAWKFLATALGVAYFYVLVNWLGPENYGLFALVSSILATPSFAVYSGINYGVIKYVSEFKDKKVVESGLKLHYILSIAMFLIFFLSADLIEAAYSKPFIAVLIRILSFQFLLNPLIETAKASSLGIKRVRYIISIEFLSRISMFILVPSLLLLGYGLFGAAVGYVLSFIVVGLYSFNVLKKINLGSRGFRIKRLLRFSFYSFIYNFLKVFQVQVVMIIAGFYLSARELGYYAFATKIPQMTLGIFYASLSNILFPYFSEFFSRGETERVSKYLSATVKFMLLIGSLFFLILLIFINPVLNVFFTKYTGAASVVIAIFLVNVFSYSFSLFASVLKGSGRIDMLARAGGIGSVASIVSSLYFIPKFGINGLLLAIYVYSFAFIFTLFIFTKRSGIYFNLHTDRSEMLIFKKVFKKVIKVVGF